MCLRGFEPDLAVSFEKQLPWQPDGNMADSIGGVYLRILVHGEPWCEHPNGTSMQSKHMEKANSKVFEGINFDLWSKRAWSSYSNTYRHIERLFFKKEN